MAVPIPKTFASLRNWYEINAYGSRLLLVLGCFLVAVGWPGRALAPPPTSPWAVVFFLIPLLALIPVVVLVNAFSRRLPDV